MNKTDDKSTFDILGWFIGAVIAMFVLGGLVLIVRAFVRVILEIR